MSDRPAPLPVSAFVICKDEAAVIERCLRSVDFAAQIVVVDSGSTDGTLEIVARLRDADGLPITLIERGWPGYGAQKQFALEQCDQPWCLSIDSDERVSPRLRAALPGLLEAEDVACWRLTRYDFLVGHGYVPPASHERYHNRLVRLGKGRFDPTDTVHEGLKVEGATRKATEGGLLHFNPVPLHPQMLKENTYSTLKADLKASRGQPARPAKMLVSPWVFFLRWYFGHGLWRCGWAGFIAAGRGGVYSFLTEAKRWEADALARRPVEEPDEAALRAY